MRDRVRIGIATRNRAALLAKALESVRAQSWVDCEVVVVDDGSEDETFALSTEFPQVRWVRRDHSEGYVSARNEMMSAQGAEFFVSLDDDAWFLDGDEIEAAVKVLRERPQVVALALDILSPDQPDRRPRGEPRTVGTFIGCGHVLRLSAVEEVGCYVPNPGSYGGEESDLCVRLLDAGHEILLLPGVHVWHEKTRIARDLSAQRTSGVCNDLAFATRRCPFPFILWLLPAKVVSHLLFAARANDFVGTLRGIIRFLRHFPSAMAQRHPVRPATLREFRRRSRSSA